MLRRFHLIIPFFFICFWATAQNPHPYFRNYTTDDGLASSEVHACIQDTAGYIWFATDNGVSRFDGYEFKNYGLQEGLRHPVVFYMQQDPEGKIWLGTMNGHLYFIEKDRIHPFEQNDMIEEENQTNGTLTDFYIDSIGNKYLSIKNKCILKFSPNQFFEKICPQNPDIPRIGLLVEDKWMIGNIPTNDFFRNKYASNIPNQKVALPFEMHADSIFYLDTFLVISNNNSSSCFFKKIQDNQFLEFRESYFFKWKGDKRLWRFQSKLNTHQKAIHIKKDGSILIGFVKGKGIRKYKTIDAIPQGLYEKYLEGISVADIFQDRDGAYWIASLEHGIFYCPDFDLKIYDKSAGFPIDYVSTFDFKNEKEMFVGFRNGQVRRLDLEEDAIHILPKPTYYNIIYDIFYDKKREELWATTGVANLFEKNKNSWKGIRQTPSVAAQNNILAKKMTLGRKEQILWGTSFRGFGALDLDTKIQSFISWNHGIEARTFRIWEDQQNRIWVGNVDGLFELKNNQLVAPQPFFSQFQTRVEDIAELSDGTLVLASKGEGVLFWKENYFRQLTAKDGLTSDMLENVYVDEQDQVWAGTLTGLNKIVRRGEEFLVEKFTNIHGLPSNEITKVKSINGNIWVATTKGLIEWKEKERSSFSKKPLIEKMLVNDLPFDFSVKNKLSYTEDNLAFQFLTVNYNQDGKIPYRFRLNDNNWNLTQNRSVNFAKLTSGKYRFEVQSQNENGNWSASSFVNFEIRPPFWKTWGFIFLSAIVLLGLVVRFYKNRLDRIRQEVQTEKEINELQRSALRAQMNPHFIFNCLNSIQNFILQNDQKNATKYLGQFAQLIRSTLNASMEEKITLEEEVRMIENYLNLEKLRFKEKMEFYIEVDEQLDQYDTMLPAMLAQPFVENALIHGLRKKANGKIEIAYRNQNNKLEITIRDNGLGIFQTQKEKQNSNRKGVGMTISQKRMELVDDNYDFTVNEIKNEKGEVLGTEVKMLLDVER